MNLTPRNGTVIVKEWIKCPSGTLVQGVYGKVTIADVKSTLGFESSDRESNWFAYVEGENEAMGILGCQIRSVFFSDEVPTHSDVLVLK